jgi:hypothetical protein
MTGNAATARKPAFLTFAILALGVTAGPTIAQPVDHSALDQLLRRNVDEQGRVDYDAFDGSSAFAGYLRTLAAIEPDRLHRDDELALWINAYNAYTIELINRHGERRSIRNINRTLGIFRGSGPWSEPLAAVGGTDYTLDEIEQDIIRRRFADPRIHFALVCAALGCPPLRREAYTGAELDAQLDDQARRFLLHDPTKNRVDVGDESLYLSRIFDWYGEDFGENPQAIGAYVATFFPAGAERDLLTSGEFRIRYTDYDWSLNSRQ